MRFGSLELEPAGNPGVLDTCTWDIDAARKFVRTESWDWVGAVAWLRKRSGPPVGYPVTFWTASASVTPEALWVLVDLPDAQTILLYAGIREPASIVGEPFERSIASDGALLLFYPASAPVLDAYTRLVRPDKASQALGALPRLGIGTRMTTQVWPGIFDAMAKGGLAANSIQNSIRELSLLDDLKAARPPEKNYSTGIGTIETGWTGSTYEGLWVAGVLAALKRDDPLRYGADADHIQVKRGPDGVMRARRVIKAARYYSFYTLDMSDILDYSALVLSPAAAESAFSRAIPDPATRLHIAKYHMDTHHIDGRSYRLSTADIGRFVGKYWDALKVVDELASYIVELKAGVAFDLELTIDEHPPEIAAFDCLTSDNEVLFLALEIKRRGLPITHLAPNFGQEKGHDYRCPDGLVGLEPRARAQFEIAAHFGLMLDVHSGDDLSSKTRRVFGRASKGRLHFKVSPMLQLIYAETLMEFHPDLFNRWWDDAYEYAKLEAAAGSAAGIESFAELGSGGAPRSPKQKVFHYFSFRYVGRRDASGQFVNRSEFYRLSPEFLNAYRLRTSAWLGEVADDVFSPSD